MRALTYVSASATIDRDTTMASPGILGASYRWRSSSPRSLETRGGNEDFRPRQPESRSRFPRERQRNLEPPGFRLGSGRTMEINEGHPNLGRLVIFGGVEKVITNG